MNYDKLKVKQIIKAFDNIMGNNYVIQRVVIDTILEGTGTGLDTENEICTFFGKKDYSKLTDRDSKIVQELESFLLHREIKMVKLTMKYLKKMMKNES